MTSNAYSFLSWLRTGLATRITAPPATADRATVPVQLRLNADGTPLDVQQTVQIYGPGDVIGVDPRAISRTEPRPWITNVEPNYLAHVEFYDPDFAWRYSPAGRDDDTRRLAPWLALVVLAGPNDPQRAEDETAEFTEGVLLDRPLPFITVDDPATTLPLPDQLGAFAHVHVNGTLDGAIVADIPADAPSAILARLAELSASNPDATGSRLICPRFLAPNTGYHAFLVPTFETGRLAGLGLDPALSPGATHFAWRAPYENQPLPGVLPYYFRWFFRTGSAGDFEYLVRLLQPREPDPRVGRRDIDVHRPAGPGLPGITTPTQIGGVLRLGGALRIPERDVDAWDNWDGRFDEPDVGLDYPHPFQDAMAGLINLAEAYKEQTPAAAHSALAARTGMAVQPAAAQPMADDVDPVITPPLYGRWHALTSRLLREQDGTPVPNDRNWVHRLNLDPRFRVAANFGTEVVQARQEEFMAAAWAQVGDVLAANSRIRAGQLAREVGFALRQKHIEPSAAPVLRAAARAEAPRSGRALTLTAPAHSRVTGPSGTAALAGATEFVENIAVGFKVATSRVATAPVSAPMRRITRLGSHLMRSLFDPETRPDVPRPEELVPRIDSDVDPVTAAAPKAVPPAIVTLEQLNDELPPFGPEPPAVAPGADPIDELPKSPDFVLKELDDPEPPTPGTSDSPEALRFKDALRDLNRGRGAGEVGGRTDERDRLDVGTATASMLSGLDPETTVPKHLLDSVRLPERLRPFAERFLEAMAYPVIDLPMYESLSDDRFVPNLNLIPPNSITLLETDQEFIEAFLVGLNHELARELLWREYPTDQRCSSFRQFWEPRSTESPPNETAAQRRERLYDIPPIHTWPVTSELGEHDHREGDREQADELVLVIRGELLKKYPTAAIYAHRARFQLDDNGDPDPRQERLPVDLEDPERPSTEEIKLPLYEAKVEPDIYLLGFDLTKEQAEGSDPEGSAGWFFVIKERPGDPRFGLDIGPSTRVEVWNDLAWPDVDPHGRGFIELTEQTLHVPLQDLDDPAADQEKSDQHDEDTAIPSWHEDLSSADIAYVLFQAPVLMAVHAQEMLPDA